MRLSRCWLSGGSTNLCIHLVAIARAAGLVITWSDFELLSKVTPLLAKDLSQTVVLTSTTSRAAGWHGIALR